MPRGKRAERLAEEKPELQADEEQQVEAGQAQAQERLNSTLTDDERLALLHNHKRKILAEEATISEAKATAQKAKKAQKAVYAIAMKECGGEADDEIKDLILAETPEGEAALKVRGARAVRVLQWTGAVPGTQFSFDDIASVDHYHEGKMAGIKGDTAKPPHDPGGRAYEEWMQGYHDGQGCLASGFEKLKTLHETDGTGEADELAGQVDLEETIAAAADMPGAPPPPIDTSDRPFGLADEAQAETV